MLYDVFEVNLATAAKFLKCVQMQYMTLNFEKKALDTLG